MCVYNGHEEAEGSVCVSGNLYLSRKGSCAKYVNGSLVVILFRVVLEKPVYAELLYAMAMTCFIPRSLADGL